MIFRIVIGIICMSTLIGCASTKQSANSSQLQTRMSFIESQLEDQDREIAQLRSSVEDISDQMSGAAVSTKSASRLQDSFQEPVSSQVSKENNESILRVPVTPQKVQTALQSAGYYNGAIDGKLGSGSIKAIKDFQKEHGLESDGVVGSKTWAELKNYSE